MVTIIIGNTKCKVANLTDPLVIKALDMQLSYDVQGFQFMNINNNWDGKHRLFTKNHYFPIGMLPTVERILKTHNAPYKRVDNRLPLKYGSGLALDPSSGFVPRDYQLEVVAAAKRKGGGIVRAATGSGKTLMIAMIAAEFNVKTVIYVIGIELLYQMKNTIERAYPGIKVGMVGDGQCDIQNITVATIWSAASAFNKKAVLMDSDLTPDSKKKNQAKLNKERVRAMVNDAELIFVDECQYAASETVQFLHRNSASARHRFLFSGTPWRDSGDDLLIEAVGGPKIYDINASTLIDKGWLVPPKIHFLDVPSFRGVGKTYQEVYKRFIVENDTRNELIVKATKRLVEDGRKTLILVTKISHGNHLLDLLKKDLRVCGLDGSNKSADRIEAIEEMKSGGLDVLIASKIFDQGIDIPDLNGLVLAGSGKSSARALQRIGRVIRKGEEGSGKKDAIVVDFFDNCKYLRDHSHIRNRIYSTEPNFKIFMPKR
jgi:superfamily II DNA or RNA helicase